MLTQNAEINVNLQYFNHWEKPVVFSRGRQSDT